jgi:serine protease Do
MGRGVTDVIAVELALPLLAALLLASSACGQGTSPPSSDPGAQGSTSLGFRQERPQALPNATEPQSVDASRQNAIVQAARRVAPAVVGIFTMRTEQVGSSLWDSFFFPGQERRSSGLGSGFVIDAQGIILTNEHVVRGAERIMVTLADGRDLEAELVGSDEVTDVAVVRVSGGSLPVAPLGTSQGLIIGEWAVAIGNPFANMFSNSEPTVTAGVVSAVGRHILPSSDEQGFYLGMVQTDASINPGNSGGPLVNAVGQVIGVNSSIFSHGGGSEGLGFAIPIDRALRVARDLLDHGEVRRAWLGFDVEAVQADEWGRTRGVRVSRIGPGSPAARAGVRAGTRVLEAGGRRMTAPLDFEDVLMDLRAGDEIVLSLEGTSTPVRLEAEALPTMQAERVTALENMQLITVTPGVRAEQDLQSEEGAMIVSVSPELQAYFGFRQRDVIVSINNVPIRRAEDVDRVFRELRGRRGYLRIVIERSGSHIVGTFPWQG